MSSITKFFERGTKKYDLRNKYKTWEDPKKIKKGS